ncbi:MAG TPA: diguanylate cyclase [Frankiaceae bacterium]|jgi:GGDEF domain-containing protein|nr:diguanylate cyclase [Frankiaceae bacterium]
MGLRRNASTWVRTIAGARAEAPAATPAATYLATEAKRDVDLLQAALHDPVTGLPERALLLDRIALALARARRGKTEVAVLLLALDHGRTDRALREFGEHVLRAVRDTDTVARFGPDDFAVLCDGVDDRDRLGIVAARIADGLTLDVGMEIVLADGDTPPVALLDLAEQALAETRRRREG